MRRYAFALDLVDDEKMIAEYDGHHQKIWPEIKESILSAGITVMDIYRFGNRLFMIMEVNDSFSFEQKDRMDKENAVVERWEALMWKYQRSIPGSKPGEKWVLMKQIFEL
ncbi:L-rhamnose mutarotase [Sphingobacterium shayense]|uniref:L-rhamnose mutarotase n=1 Tax=Sphingobacterium shayense TaxID=626343 RepID=UPI0015575741|nr:L-rhamnose mutarotase [Sphingobacterium shayense]NQD70677.1 L-rhamnose mutarotase [Sphingobacterium shayense]